MTTTNRKFNLRLVAMSLCVILCISFIVGNSPVFAADGASDPETAFATAGNITADDDADADAPAVVSEDEDVDTATSGNLDDDPEIALFSALLGAPVTTIAELKAAIENAVADTEIVVDAGAFAFTETLVNTKNINITLIGAGRSATKFTMDSSAPNLARFIRLPNGTLTVEGISFTGTSRKNGGIYAHTIIARDCDFTNNHGNQNVAGGGAICVGKGDIEIYGCNFTGNSCPGGSDGGAVAAQYAGSLTIEDSVFESNIALQNGNQYGGAVSIKQPDPNSTVTIKNTIFKNNVNTSGNNWSRGGAVHIFGEGNNITSIEIDNVLFEGNSTPENNGGALAFMNVKNASVTNSTFINNSASKYGGGVYFENSSNNTVTNCTFIDNKYTNGFGSGGAVGAYQSTVTVDSCTIVGNSASKSALFVKSGQLPGTLTMNHSIVYNASISTPIVSGAVAVTNSLTGTTNPFTNATVAGLDYGSAYNATLPIKTDGPAHAKITTSSRPTQDSQNGIERKSPLSDYGAHEVGEDIPLPTMLTVNFDTQGGAPVPLPQEIEEGNLVIEPATDPEKDGYAFLGWFTDAGATIKWDFGVDTVQEEMTLYAGWQKIVTSDEFTLTHNNPFEFEVSDLYPAFVDKSLSWDSFRTDHLQPKITRNADATEIDVTACTSNNYADVNFRQLGTYTVNFIATGTELTRSSWQFDSQATVIIVDKTAPVISVKYPTLTYDRGTGTRSAGTLIAAAQATALDNYDGYVAVAPSGYETIDWNTTGSYTLKLDAVDSSGNIATSNVITINIVRPNTGGSGSGGGTVVDRGGGKLTVIDDAGVPLANFEQTDEGWIIVDGDTPLANLPKTGSNRMMSGAIALGTLAILASAGLHIKRRKK